MNCRALILMGLLSTLFCCKATPKIDKKGHANALLQSLSRNHKKLSASLHKEAYHKGEAKLHKKEEMLGQDMMKINEAEFRLQSLVSPEFHQGMSNIHRGRVIGNMEVNTLSPEQVDFVQTQSQWPKFGRPNQRNAGFPKTVYPENPVLFPQQNDISRWISMKENSFKSPSGPQFEDVPVSMGNNMNSMFSREPNDDQDSGQQKSDSMRFDVRPGYTTTGDSPIDDKMPSLPQLGGGFKVEAKAPLGFRSKTKPNAMNSLLNEGIMSRHGKPLGILGNILKASQEMPSGIKASSRSGMWTTAYSRRHHLERTHPGTLHKASSILRHIEKKHDKKTKYSRE